MNRDEALLAVLKEYDEATEKHRPFNSAHEGYAVILEELDELWDEVKRVESFSHSSERLTREAVQVAAMALRFIVDIGGK